MATKNRPIRISVQSASSVLQEFASAFHDARRGKKVSHAGLSFENIDTLRRVLTNSRIEMLSIIRSKKPQSVYELSKMLHRDLKSVNTDLGILEENDLVELKRVKDGRVRLVPFVHFDSLRIDVRI